MGQLFSKRGINLLHVIRVEYLTDSYHLNAIDRTTFSCDLPTGEKKNYSC